VGKPNDTDSSDPRALGHRADPVGTNTDSNRPFVLPREFGFVPTRARRKKLNLLARDASIPRSREGFPDRVSRIKRNPSFQKGSAMEMKVSRRQFFRISAAGIGGSGLAAMGYSTAFAAEQARAFKLARTTETRNTCPYCSVGCGILMYGLGDRAKNAKSEIIHIEGDPDHPVNRGTLCPKGAGLMEFIHSPNRLKHPEVREPGSTEWKRISWNDALDRIAKLMKEDRDKNFEAKNKDGATVNRWPTMGVLAASASSNESGHITGKFVRSLGILNFDNQARV
jgi:formate dehydrogenase major subunit